jgi:ATP-binding cassette subfamily B protein
MGKLLKILKVYYHFMAQKKWRFLLFLLLIVFGALISNITPYFYKLFVDTIPGGNFQILLLILLEYMGVRVFGVIFEGFSFMIGDSILIRAAADARIAVFKKIQDLDFTFHTNKSTGSLISLFKRGDSAFGSLHYSIHHRILEVVLAFLVMLYFFLNLDIRIGILVFALFIAILIAAKYVVPLNVKTRKELNDEEDRVSAVIVDNMINYETVKLFSKENWELKRIGEAFIPWKKAFWRYGLSFRVFDVTLGGLINISIFSTFLLALWFTTTNELTLGDFVLVVGFVSQFYPRVFDLIWGFRDIAKNYADIDKYFAVLDFQVDIKDPKIAVEKEHVAGEIEYKDVNFSYKDGKKNAIRNFSLTIRQAQSVAFVGRSGAGKTTIAKLLMRFYDVDEGEILIDGTNIKAFTKSQLRSFMGVVPQEPILFDNTVAYNIGYGKEKVTQKEIVAAAKLANIHEFIESLPKKYKTRVGERGIKLSGGQKQRLAIARMILSDPDIIIFDEATSQLDSENERLIQEAFWKVAKNKTTIIIAHRLSTAKQADKIVVLEKGSIAEISTHAELLRNEKSLYRYFWNLQTAT